MVWDTCKIVLHSPSDNMFYTNDTVTGSVIFEVKQDCKVEQICLKVQGTCKIMWSRPAPTMPFIKIYSEKKEVFSVIVDDFRDLQGTKLQPGLISRQFHFLLPPDLPSSFEDDLAKVYYRIKIKSKNAYGFTKKITYPVYVIKHVNLNHLEEYKIPLLYEMTKKIGKSGQFSLIFKTYKGFTSNQLIPFEAIITNEQKIKVRKIKVFLIRKIEYNISEGLNYAEKLLCKSAYRDILNTATQSCYFHMEIPPLIPSTNHTDQMVNISYSLRVKASFRFHLPLEIDIPVTVATVPLDYHSYD